MLKAVLDVAVANSGRTERLPQQSIQHRAATLYAQDFLTVYTDKMLEGW